MASDRASIFHIYMYISLGRTLSLVPKLRSPDKVNVKYQGHSFRKNGCCGDIRVSQTHLGFFFQIFSSHVFSFVFFLGLAICAGF